jgi:hypothetical protein
MSLLITDICSQYKIKGIYSTLSLNEGKVLLQESFILTKYAYSSHEEQMICSTDFFTQSM